MHWNSIKAKLSLNILTPLNRTVLSLFLSMGILTSCRNTNTGEIPEPLVFRTPLGKEYSTARASKKLLQEYFEAKSIYMQDPNNADNIIWYGRRTAYLGLYDRAVAIFSEGIKVFPEDARFYRHRGHRLISLRKYMEAISDLEQAADLIKGTENTTEPDGMPNARNIPVSTLHGNIWYHLGLAYYLTHQYEKAYKAYLMCKASGKREDNLVSSTHWLYMIQRRLGNAKKAEKLLDPIKKNAKVIENHNYYRLCKFYKGLIPLDTLINANTKNAAADALQYGLANWYFYNDNKAKSKSLMEEIVAGDNWSSFGYLAAESDLIHYFK